MLKQMVFDYNPAVRLSNLSLCGEAFYRVEKKICGHKMNVRIHNLSKEPLKIKEVLLFAGELPVPSDTEFYAEGFHMLSQYRGTLDNPRTVGAWGDDESFFHFPRTVFQKDLTTVYSLLLLSPEAAEKELLAFSSCLRFHGEFRFKGNYLEIVQNTEDKELAPGEWWDMEELTVHSGADRESLMEALGQDIECNHPKKQWEEMMTGWCSYYALRPMTAEGLYANARAMKERIPELKRIQIDGGYEKHNGDWLIPNPVLGAGMQEICDTIREIGIEPIGYISPFIVENESDVFKEHPEWLLHDENGKPYNEIGHVKKWYFLDVTHPEAVAYLRKIINVMHDEWGFRYFKLDFLAYGALPGYHRYDDRLTSVEAFRLGIKIITDLVEKDSFILGRNAPFWPQLGLVHANRASNDIYRSWKQVGGNAEEEFLRNWQDKRLWINDPDCALMEPLDFDYVEKGERKIKKSLLTPEEFAFHRAFIVASGGMVLSGDLLYEISDETIIDLRKMIQTAGTAAVFDDDSLTVGRIQDKNLVCVFNFEEKQKDVEFRVNGVVEVHDFWSGAYVGTYEDIVTRPALKGHYGEVLQLTEISK